MIEIIDVLLPNLTLAIETLLTIPVFRLIRKSNYKTVGWFIAVFAVAGATAANLALNTTVHPRRASSPRLKRDAVSSIFSSVF